MDAFIHIWMVLTWEFWVFLCRGRLADLGGVAGVEEAAMRLEQAEKQVMALRAEVGEAEREREREAEGWQRRLEEARGERDALATRNQELEANVLSLKSSRGLLVENAEKEVASLKAELEEAFLRLGREEDDRTEAEELLKGAQGSLNECRAAIKSLQQQVAEARGDAEKQAESLRAETAAARGDADALRSDVSRLADEVILRNPLSNSIHGCLVLVPVPTLVEYDGFCA
jgi:chromosome segregation ATPase